MFPGLNPKSDSKITHSLSKKLKYANRKKISVETAEKDIK